MSTSSAEPPSCKAPDSLARIVYEIACGKCNWDGRLVTPDPRKGRITVEYNEVGELHIKWMTRPGNVVENDIPVGDGAYLERIKDSKTGRIYVLKRPSSNETLLFWLQDKNVSIDKDNIFSFNFLCQGPASPSVMDLKSMSYGSGGNLAVIGQSPVPASPLVQHLPPAQHEACPVDDLYSEGFAGKICDDLDDMPPDELQMLLDGNLAGRLRDGERRQSFNSFLPSRLMMKLLDDPVAVSEMLTYLPEGGNTIEDLREAIMSSEMQAAMAAFTQDVYSESFPLIMSSMGLSYDLDGSNLAFLQDPIHLMVEALEQPHGWSDDAEFTGNVTGSLIEVPQDSSNKKNKSSEDKKDDESSPGPSTSS